MKREKLIKEIYKKYHEKYPDNYTLNKYLGNSIDITNYYEIQLYITRLEVGGTSGTRGNFSYRNQKGVVRISKGVLEQLYGELWMRRMFWKKGIK